MILLDTHALIWFITNDSKLSPAANQLIAKSSKVLVSTATLWEIAIKLSIGKLDMGGTFDDLFPTHLDDNNFTLLPMTLAHLSHVGRLPFHHRDPFDRLLIAQSMTENMPIISKDAHFDAYSVTRLW